MIRSVIAAAIVSISVGSWSCKPRVDSDLSSDATTSGIDGIVQKLDQAIATYYKLVNEEERAKIRRDTWNLLKDLDAKNPEALGKVFSRLATILPQTKNLPPEQQLGTVQLMTMVIKTEINNKGKFAPWDELETKVRSQIQTSADGPGLVSDLQRLGRTSFLNLNPGWKLMNDGRPSWIERHERMKSASKSIWILSWAFYNDQTGREAVEVLKAKAKAGVDVRIVVDGPISMRPGYTESIQEMSNNGIKVIRWGQPSLLGFGMHRKMMILDHATANGSVIFGGKNFGDVYSHMKDMPDEGVTSEEWQRDELDRWRDTDMLVLGAPVLQAAHDFALAWNDYVNKINSGSGYDAVVVPKDPPAKSGAEKFAFIDHDPTASAKPFEFNDPIYLATLRMIASARSEVFISNAYFINTKPMESFLVEAMNRGVKVRVHTNSEASMAVEDKPLLGPIYRSLRQIIDVPQAVRTADFVAPAVHLQKYSTLHSKYIVVDGKYGWVGSYNIHPRSSRYESESVGMFYGSQVGQQVRKMFSDDTNPDKAESISSLDRLKLPPSQLFDLVESFIFEQL